jgi:hypothetical protein
MDYDVDSYRYISGITKRLVKSWIKMEEPREIPWTPLTKPLAESRVAMISSAAVALKTDKPFDQERERRNPWWGDPSYRILPNTVTEEDVNLYHLHIDPVYAKQDLNCLFPVQRLNELERLGEIGSASPRHYSFMGYIVDPHELLQETTPSIVRDLREDLADVVVLVPA